MVKGVRWEINTEIPFRCRFRHKRQSRQGLTASAVITRLPRPVAKGTGSAPLVSGCGKGHWHHQKNKSASIKYNIFFI